MNKMEQFRQNIDQLIKDSDLEHISNLFEVGCTGRSVNPDMFRTTIDSLPDISKPKIKILVFSIKSIVLIKKLILKYQEKCLFLDITVLLDNEDELSICKSVSNRYFSVSSPSLVKYVVKDILNFEFNSKFDLTIGIPESTKVYGSNKQTLRQQFNDPGANNVISFITHKCMNASSFIVLVLPKYFLHNEEYALVRQKLSDIEIMSIIDYAEYGFFGSYMETVCLTAYLNGKPGQTQIVSPQTRERITQQQAEITDPKFPNWIIYKDDFFKSVADKLEFNVLKVHRDRSISASISKAAGQIRILTAKNIPRHKNKVIFTDQDLFVDAIDILKTKTYRYIYLDDVYLCPNLTSHPRLVTKITNTVASGSLAIFSCIDGNPLTDAQQNFFSSTEFERFYKIARNHCTRSLNIDKNAAFYFGKLKKTEEPQ